MIDIQRLDTICAIATAKAPSAIGIIRVSGKNALEIKDKIFIAHRGVHKPFVATHGNVVEFLNHSEKTVGNPDGAQDPKVVSKSDINCKTDLAGMDAGLRRYDSLLDSRLHGNDKLIRENDFIIIDDAVCIYFPDNKSYTGEPSFELHVHGSLVILNKCLAILQNLGCRLAQPGEFSMRAVLNGKLDLCQAEAVADLIHAQSERAAQIALRNLDGALKNKLQPVRETIIDALCELEARMDFPDEEIGYVKSEKLIERLEQSKAILLKLLSTTALGQRLTQGSRIVLYGLPNAGKSTLLNTLLQKERALVHDSSGTTRDVIEASWMLNDIPITLVDVAGIRALDEAHPIEAMGIQKALEELRKADLVVCLHDQTQLKTLDLSPLAQIQVPVLHVQNKVDLSTVMPASATVIPAEAGIQGSDNSLNYCAFGDNNVVNANNHDDSDFHQNDKTLCTLPISAKLGYGIDNLKAQLHFLLVVNESANEEIILTNARQQIKVEAILEGIWRAMECLDEREPHELAASELRSAGKACDELFGTNLNEEVLDLIFSRFCIGK